MDQGGLEFLSPINTATLENEINGDDETDVDFEDNDGNM